MADESPSPLQKAIQLQQDRIQAGFTDGGQTGPHEAALHELHNAAALAPPKVFTIGDREFILDKPTNADLIGIRRHLIECVQATMKGAVDATMGALKRMRADAAQSNGTKELPFDEEDRKALLEIAVAAESKKTGNAKTAGKSEPTGRQLEEYMLTVDGVREYLWCRLRGQEPAVGREWIAQHVTDANMLDIARQLGDDTGLTLIDPKSKRD